MQTIVPESLLQGLGGLQYLLDTNNGNNFVADTVLNNPTIIIAGTAQAARIMVGEVVSASGDAGLVGAAVKAVAVIGGNTHVTLTANATATAAGVAFTILDQCVVRLAVAPFSPGPNPTPGDFVEVADNWYVPKPIHWQGKTPYFQPDGTAEVDGGVVSWVCAVDPVTPQTIVGYFVTYFLFGTGILVWCFEELPNLPMQKAGDGIAISLPLRFFSPGSVTIVGG